MGNIKSLDFSIILMVIGLVFLFLGFALDKQTKAVINQDNITTATIVSAKFEWERKNNKAYLSHNVYISFTVDGVKYTTQYPSEFLSFKHKEGKTIDIYYDAKDPSKVAAVNDGSLSFTTFWHIITAIIFAIAIINAVVVIKNMYFL